MSGKNRNALSKINKLMEMFPIVLILGARQAGKTTLAKMYAPSWEYFDMQKQSDYELIVDNINLFFKQYSEKVIIDEAQEFPQIFKELRGVIDEQRNKKARFILTGSSSPELLKEASDSLAGRIGIVEIGTMKFNEIVDSQFPEFYKIFDRPLCLEDDYKILSEINTSNQMNLFSDKAIDTNKIMKTFLKGGYPEPVLSDNNDFFVNWMENYYQTYINRDIKKLFPKLDEIKYRRFISMLSRLSGNIINKAELGRSVGVSEVTIADYIDIADKTFIWRKIPAYSRSISKSVLKMPKGIFRDSGLNNYLSNISSQRELISFHNLGRAFESFVIEEILKAAILLELGNLEYSYYRTKNGAEIDLILEGNFGTLPIEIKYGDCPRKRDITSLIKFVHDKKLAYGLVISNFEKVKLIDDKIIHIPVGLI